MASLSPTSPLTLSEPFPAQSYGSIQSHGEGTGLKTLNRTRVDSLLSVPEEGEDGEDDDGDDGDDDSDWELEEQGLYRGMALIPQ
jgi:hypothetical protein